MQSSTGCKINVSQASGADIEREIGLVGTRQAIEDAKRAIWEKVDQVVSLLLASKLVPQLIDLQKEKNGTRRGGGRDSANYNDSYSQPQQQQQPSYGQPTGQASAPAPAAQGDAAADPYAPYGGYQNYVAMWYLSQGYQPQPGQGAQGPPGA